jgi:hypothetical protein
VESWCALWQKIAGHPVTNDTRLPRRAGTMDCPDLVATTAPDTYEVRTLY